MNGIVITVSSEPLLSRAVVLFGIGVIIGLSFTGVKKSLNDLEALWAANAPVPGGTAVSVAVTVIITPFVVDALATGVIIAIRSPGLTPFAMKIPAFWTSV